MRLVAPGYRGIPKALPESVQVSSNVAPNAAQRASEEAAYTHLLAHSSQFPSLTFL